MTKFVLTGALKGKTITLGMNKYPFIDGEFECADEDADKIGVILTNYYAAKRVDTAVEERVVAEVKTEPQPEKSK